jgi:chemotaxis protein methyltransferase CheR
MNTADFDYVRNFVRDQAAIVLEPGKEYLVESRLLILARKEKLASIDELIRKLRSDPKNGLHRKVVDAMTTNETSFFRDIHPFEALRKSILPELMTRRAAQRQINFWCGAASTGQEPYSVLMLIAEHFPQLLKWDIKFIATDLCSEVLARSRAGCFSQLEVNRGLPANLLVKYFVRQGTSWEIREDLRRRVEFRELNLVKDWPSMPPLDIVFLRNVLIYFDLETKKTILAKARRLLRPGSYLLLGGAETTFNIDDAFEREVIDKATCYRVKQE